MKLLLITMFTSFLLLTNLRGQEEWEIMNEGVGYAETFDFINGDIGWIAGEKGIMKTSDGGETWSYLCGISNIQEIDFYNDTLGWAIEKIGTQYAIYKTSDGGITWQNQKDSSLTLTSFIVVNELTVYATGRHILKTIDGGTTWENISPMNNSFFSFGSFQNLDTGIVVNVANTIYRTFDGGISWEARKLSEFSHIQQLNFSDGNTVYFIARNSKDVYFKCKTNDYFNTWTVIHTDPQPVQFCHFFDDKNFLTLAKENGSQYLKIYLYKITDTGLVTSSTEHIPLNVDREYKLIVNAQAAYLLSTGFLGSTVLHRSTDQGNHWTCKPISFPINDVHFVNRQEGFIGGRTHSSHGPDEGAVFRTQNGGKNWDMVLTATFVPKEIHFVNESKGFVTGWRGSFSSTDGGDNWEVDSTIFDVSAMCFLNDSIGWAISNEALIRTSDCGQSWGTILNLSSITHRHIESLFFPDEISGFGVGDGGLILRFSGEGAWEKIKPGTSLPLNKVYFVDDEFGLIAGGYSNDDGFRHVLLITLDGGDHWAKIPDIPYLIHDLYFPDSLQGYAAGEDEDGRGVLLETFDKGQNWNKVALEKDLSGSLNALHFSDGIGWAVGENSLILKYVSSNTSDQENNDIEYNIYFLSYPNPFRSSTMISYQLSTTGDVKLSIYDLSGRKIATLVNESQLAGKHELGWNADGIQPGIYICELKTGQNKQVIKMILIDSAL